MTAIEVRLEKIEARLKEVRHTVDVLSDGDDDRPERENPKVRSQSDKRLEDATGVLSECGVPNEIIQLWDTVAALTVRIERLEARPICCDAYGDIER